MPIQSKQSVNIAPDADIVRCKVFTPVLTRLCPRRSLLKKDGGYLHKTILPANFLNPALNSSSTSWCSALEEESGESRC